MMQLGGFCLGGEQSGHLIFLDDATTGDGQLAAVKFLEVVSRSGKKLSELANAIPTYPQILHNIPIVGGNEVKNKIMNNEQLLEKIALEQAALGKRGRILVRPSGTEALIRVMVEAMDNAEAERVVAVLTECIEKCSKSF